ncbi:MAG TPA: hypothetical protein V6D48_26105 [Oculatellaceae cyanobacterium]
MKLNLAVYAIPIMQYLHQIFDFAAFEMGKAITSPIAYPITELNCVP